MRINRFELELDESVGMQMAVVGCLLMVAQSIGTERPDDATILRDAARALAADVPEDQVRAIAEFAARVVRSAKDAALENKTRVH